MTIDYLNSQYLICEDFNDYRRIKPVSSMTVNKDLLQYDHYDNFPGASFTPVYYSKTNMLFISVE